MQVQESLHTPLGLCGVTGGDTVAGPGSPPPSWPISGESYRRVPHAETDDVKVVFCGSCVPILCVFLEACNQCRDWSRPSPDDFRALSRRKSARTLASSFLMS